MGRASASLAEQEKLRLRENPILFMCKTMFVEHSYTVSKVKKSLFTEIKCKKSSPCTTINYLVATSCLKRIEKIAV